MKIEEFKKSMSVIYSATKFNHKFDENHLKQWFLVMKDDFTDSEFSEICIKYLKTNTDFPAIADFYKLKKKPHIPDCDTLYDEFQGYLGGSRNNTIDSRWMLEVRKYFSGRTPGNWRDRTEDEMAWCRKDWDKAYDLFMKDYESGKNIRINFDNIPEITDGGKMYEEKGSVKIGDIIKRLEI